MIKKVILSVIFVVLVFAFTGENYPVTVEFFDVGQGDSSMITIHRDFQVLVDGGPSEDILDHLQKTMPFYDKKIEVIILTHADADHITGLLEVIQDYEVLHIYMPDWQHDSKLYSSWLQLVEEEQANIRFVTDPFTLQLPAGEIEFFHPSSITSEFRDVNNESVVFKFSLGGVAILFPGDIEEVVEKRLVLEYGTKLKSTLLKVPHHGSKTSSSVEFLDMVTPRLAVIQAGDDNKFGHPHSRVVDRYTRRGIMLFRNDIEETIRFRLNSAEIWSDNGMEVVWEWIIGKNWERVYNLGT